MTKVEIAPATAEDIASFYPQAVLWRVRALTMRVDDVIVAIGGHAVMPDGVNVAFVEISEETCRRYPLALERGARRFFKETKDRGTVRLIASCQAGREAAARWLAHLGFKLTGNVDGTDIYAWRSNRGAC